MTYVLWIISQMPIVDGSVRQFLNECNALTYDVYVSCFNANSYHGELSALCRALDL
jgi:hypothetical protein